ncbi:hypothetical protein QYE76_017651 [Lolium multiflorum]|uniref:F-box domain-containing protein n=1 Tax=Lolium multiflorum TaxID=4521 RepID=A0AAD8VAE1_LOLMU|nr:hypothetical protein QYE76_017651 [Lolium multiflorum]
MPPSSARRDHVESHLLPSVTELRDWASLPSDVLLLIFSRIPQADVLCAAGLACTSWRRLAIDEPLLWRHIDLASSNDPAMARAAVDRSAGMCDSFHGCVDDADFLRYLADSAPSLRSLRVTRRFDMLNCDKELITGAIKKLPLLEQLVLPFRWVDEDTLLALIDHCPRLQLLDASRSYAAFVMDDELRARLQSRINNLQLPHQPKLVPCSLCVEWCLQNGECVVAQAASGGEGFAMGSYDDSIFVGRVLYAGNFPFVPPDEFWIRARSNPIKLSVVPIAASTSSSAGQSIPTERQRESHVDSVRVSWNDRVKIDLVAGTTEKVPP